MSGVCGYCRYMNRRTINRYQSPFVAFVRAGQVTFERSVALDLSAGGVRVQLSQLMSGGDTVTVNLRVDDQRIVSYQARVQWLKKGRNGTYQAGLSWENSGSTADRRWLESWLHRQDLASYSKAS